MTAADNGFINYKHELLRKSIHLCSLSIPIIYYFVTKELALTILVPLTIFSLILDFGRHVFPPLNKLFTLLFDFMLREHEKDPNKKNLSGASYVLLASTLSILFFPKLFAITGIAVLILGDIAAALIGRKFGKHKFFFKSLEGTLAFFVVSCIVVLLIPKVEGLLLEYIIGFIAAAVGALAENLSYGWADDNLTIPISVGLTMALLYWLLLPELIIALPNVPG
ncbi:MAG: dolichol kinase [Ignavibacteriae bacterium]|nr:dolichol kinase [Ignavibacteriota bacterium]NOG97831.1 dolichol kinase [Ignavibacteriota bacterium]